MITSWTLQSNLFWFAMYEMSPENGIKLYLFPRLLAKTIKDITRHQQQVFMGVITSIICSNQV